MFNIISLLSTVDSVEALTGGVDVDSKTNDSD